ncbi:MAG: hypothetical protein Q4B99_01055 [Clostridia bacterium]|nr:hypothetical protein [Clostridia bacterium]
MRLWGLVRKGDKVLRDALTEHEGVLPSDVGNWDALIAELCAALDLAAPVVLRKHIDDLRVFSHVAFRRDDFLEEVAFDRFELRILLSEREKKRATE